MMQRKNERYDFHVNVAWDFFAQRTGGKAGRIINVSKTGCLLQTNEYIENRRWIRFIIQDHSSNLQIACVGRVVRCKILTKTDCEEFDTAIYDYGIEFTFPNYFSLGDTDLIFALSKRNLMVRSCLNLNSKSSFRPGFLA